MSVQRGLMNCADVPSLQSVFRIRRSTAVDANLDRVLLQSCCIYILNIRFSLFKLRPECGRPDGIVKSGVGT